jgi:acetyl-CoA acyltransferase
VVDDVIFGCANQAGEDNRNVARMALLLAGLPVGVPGTTDQPALRLGHGRGDHRGARHPAGEADLIIAGGVESMSRAPFVMPKADSAFSRHAEIHDTTIGWRFVNPLMKAQYGVDSMPETGENVAEEFGSRAPAQDAFACARRPRPRRPGKRPAGRGDHAGQHPQRKGDPSSSTPTSIRAPHHDRGAGQAQAAVSAAAR